MKSLNSFFNLWPILLVLVCTPTLTAANEIKIAVASNFVGAMKAIADEFEMDTKQQVILIPGSTGRHYAQIVNGAPFDLFFAADSKRAELLEKQGLSVLNSRFTYAIGKLVLWSAIENYVDSQGEVISKDDFLYLAIANPKFAPYGEAAKEVLKAKNLWQDIQGKLVHGKSLFQTYQFVSSGNAEIGFVAYSQILKPGEPVNGSYWLVPDDLYFPIEQQVVLLKNSNTAMDFLDYIKSDKALEIIKSFGYDIPKQAK